MGSGKTVVAKALAKELKRTVISTDELIEKKEKKIIREIFRESGENYFRRLEREAVKEISQKENVIIDCGGGVVINPDNMADLRHNGIIFYLSTSPEYIYKRVKDHPHRPLLNVDDPLRKIKELLEKRKKFYEKADYTLDTNGKTPEQNCEEVLEIIRHE